MAGQVPKNSVNIFAHGRLPLRVTLSTFKPTIFIEFFKPCQTPLFKCRKILSTFLRHDRLPLRVTLSECIAWRGKATACQGEGNAWLEWLGQGHIMGTACQGKARQAILSLAYTHFLGMHWMMSNSKVRQRMA
jgi:hypothetical protein